MKSKRTVLIISCLIGLISASGYMSRIQSIRDEITDLTEMAPALTASRTVHAGERLQPDTLTAVMVPRKSLSRRALTPDDLELVSNRRTLNTIPAGDTVLWTDLPEGPRLKNPSERIPPGYRAIALPADEIHTMVHFLSPGDKVDVLASSFSESAGGLITDTVAEGILILGVGLHLDSWDRSDEESDYPLSVTLLAEPAIAARILKASQVGEVHFLVRGRDILSEILGKETTILETDERKTR
ncbi:MAG: Flp pilus assembly protein CpaB [bacterium]|nr:Flp pilus assembly protein CpaB [bacterium]MDT8395522.1 Flp pilus assembly protein CpaB [bacterium]